MPGDPEACRAHAKNCLRLAAEARTESDREHFESLAKRWMAMATDLEVTHVLLETWGTPEGCKKSSKCEDD